MHRRVHGQTLGCHLISPNAYNILSWVVGDGGRNSKKITPPTRSNWLRPIDRKHFEGAQALRSDPALGSG